MSGILDKVNLPLNDDNKAKIIEAIKAEVKLKGISRIGEHADKVLKPFAGGRTHFSLIRRVEVDITASGKYKSVDHPTYKEDFEIRLNPDYKSKGHDYKLALFTGLITLLIGILLWKLDQRSKLQEIEQLKTRMDALEKKVDRQTTPRK